MKDININRSKIQMKKIMIATFVLISILISGCNLYQSPDPRDFVGDEENDKKLFIEQYDPIANEGQYWFPKQKLGTNYWIVVNATSNTKSFDDNNLQNHILAESIIGLTALAVNEGTSSTMVWTDSPNSNYAEVLDQTGLTQNGAQTTWELLEKHDNVKSHIDGYVLCKMRKQESINVATVASHVFRAVIVDEYYEDKIIELGYELKYDARDKTMEDAWSEFKDECNNDALVLMPTLTGNLKSFAIANRLMSVNYNKKMGNSFDNNKEVFKEVLDWLNPLSPVIGWESGLGEDVFVNLVSKSGNMMVPSDWIWNTTMMSGDYENRQPGLAQVTNPQFIDFDETIHYASFFLTDGDNVQWMMNNFRTGDYYTNELNSDVRMSFGLPVANLSMISPYQLNRLFNEQAPNNTLIEFGGGGYYYPDNFGINKNRTELLDGIAKKVGSHMKQHRVKVLGLLCQNVTSAESKEAYEAYISNNDQLVGIIAVQYNPYAGGDGEVMWFTNSNGIDIPVVTVKYAIWNHGNHNQPSQGTPTYIAHKLNELAEQSSTSHSLVAVHAWSMFKDIGDSDDELEENNAGSTVGIYPVSWCANKLSSKTKVVNVEELIWQIRMLEKPEQTESVLNEYY